ncbi:hypothetical protein [Neobacillus terrae]|uniref:hypothetical protein n=1 Tax=Neobacillus terrae TaxID=3034837 RepID=UPI0014075E83|nr:hypothetical protein [Neobacillus terrae]NHM32421.1 hypothetical protein [Neobacillus terrae]
MKSRKLLILSIISSIFTILYEVYQWKLVDLLSPFIAPFLWLFLFGFFAFVTFKSFKHLFKRKDWIPSIIQTVTLLVIIFFPFTKMTLDMDFKMNKHEREKVVEMVQNNKLKQEDPESTLIQLPRQYKHLSKGEGEIVVEKAKNANYILFFTYRGILDNFSGFVYSSTGQKPSRNAFNGDFKEVEKLDKHWYFVGSY